MMFKLKHRLDANCHFCFEIFATYFQDVHKTRSMQMKLQAIALIRPGERHHFLISEDSKVEKQMLCYYNKKK